MKIRSIIKRVIPNAVLSSIRSRIEAKEFRSLGRLECPTSNLKYIDSISLSEIFYSDEINELWEESKKEIELFDIPDATGGVNPGDRRALYYLICKLNPSSVLEIGTHIGASTVHIASALSKNEAKETKLITVDIRDVNSAKEKPWLEFGMKHSPAHMIDTLNYSSIVNFVAADSLDFLERVDHSFDFIFLDGSHTPASVYQEIPAASKILNPDGVLLLHDYFPGMKPLWSNGSVEKGPFMATERLIEEGVDLEVLPLGRLPWKTKLNSNLTSLALVLKKSTG